MLLVELGLVRPRINFKKQVSLLDLRSLHKGRLDQVAGDLRDDVIREDALGLPGEFGVVRDFPLDGLTDRNHRHFAGATFAAFDSQPTAAARSEQATKSEITGRQIVESSAIRIGRQAGSVVLMRGQAPGGIGTRLASYYSPRESSALEPRYQSGRWAVRAEDLTEYHKHPKLRHQSQVRKRVQEPPLPGLISAPRHIHFVKKYFTQAAAVPTTSAGEEG